MTQDEARQELRQWRADVLEAFCCMFGFNLHIAQEWEAGQREIPEDVREMLAYMRQERMKGDHR